MLISFFNNPFCCKTDITSFAIYLNSILITNGGSVLENDIYLMNYKPLVNFSFDINLDMVISFVRLKHFQPNTRNQKNNHFVKYQFIQNYKA